MVTTRYIQVKFQREGLHTYVDAPEPVAFLRNQHRHIFWHTVSVEVFHNERDIEFIMFKRELEGRYDGTIDINNKSCETLAEELMLYINAQYPGRIIIVEVSEDNENSAIITMHPVENT